MIFGLLWIAFLVWLCWFVWQRWGRDMIVTEPSTAVEKSGGVALLERWKPKPKPEPTEADRIYERGARTPPKDPLGKISERRLRVMAAEIKAAGQPWPLSVPGVLPACYICKTERVPSAGVLICISCDRYERVGVGVPQEALD